MSCERLEYSDKRRKLPEPGSGKHKPGDPGHNSRRGTAAAQSVRRGGADAAPRKWVQSQREDAGERTRAARPGAEGATGPWRTSKASRIFAAAAWPCSAATTPRPAGSSASAALGCRCVRSPLSPARCG